MENHLLNAYYDQFGSKDIVDNHLVSTFDESLSSFDGTLSNNGALPYLIVAPNANNIIGYDARKQGSIGEMQRNAMYIDQHMVDSLISYYDATHNNIMFSCANELKSTDPLNAAKDHTDIPVNSGDGDSYENTWLHAKDGYNTNTINHDQATFEDISNNVSISYSNVDYDGNHERNLKMQVNVTSDYPMNVNDSLFSYYDIDVNNIMVFDDYHHISNPSHANVLKDHMDGLGASSDDNIYDEELKNDPIVNEEKAKNSCKAITSTTNIKSSCSVNKSQTTRKSKKMHSEQKRRKKLNEKLYALRALVPTINKMDKASIVKDAIRYVRDLEKQADEMRTNLARLHHILEFHVTHIEGKRYSLQLHCKKSSNVLLQLVRAMELIEVFDILHANLIALSDRIVNVISIEVKTEKFMKVEQIQQIILKNVVKFGFVVASVERVPPPTT